MKNTVERKRLTICSNGSCCNPAVESYNFCLSCEDKADAYRARIDGWRQTASELCSEDVFVYLLSTDGVFASVNRKTGERKQFKLSDLAKTLVATAESLPV